MSNLNCVSQKVLFQQDNVKAVMPQSTDLVDCNITIYEHKTIQILKQRQSQTSINKNSPNLIKLREIINIDLNLLYSINFIENNQNLNKTPQKSSFIPNLIITNLQTNQRYSFYLNNLKSQIQKIKKSLSTTSWIYQTIWQKYQLVHEINNKTSYQNNKKIKFLVLKDIETFKNYFVKLYKKSNFIQTPLKKLNLSPIIHQVTYQNLIKYRHIMRYSKFIEDGEYFYLFYQEKPIKMFSQYIEQSKQLPSSKIRSIMRQLLKTIQVLSESQILHNNIKSSSIFIVQNNDGCKVCLGEFQYACSGAQAAIEYDGGVRQKSQQHLAPQLMKQNEFYGEFNEFNSDVFSLGLVFHELLFNKPLYNQTLLLTKNQNQTLTFQQTHYQTMNGKCLDLFKQLVEYDPNFRTTAKQALNHQYFILHQTLTESSFLRTYSTLKSYDNVIDKKDIKDIKDFKIKTQTQNKRIRNRYYQTFYIKKFIPLQQNRPKTQKSQKRVKINAEQQFLSSIPHKENFFEALIDQLDMDDSHHKLMPRDVRSMKPALAFCSL